MKDNVLEVLLFLYDNYFGDGSSESDEQSVAELLQHAGFDVGDITEAFDWLGELMGMQATTDKLVAAKGASTRVFSWEETNKLDVACRSFLLQLEEMGILDPKTREIILDRAMAIPGETLSLLSFKKIVGFVLLNHPRYEEMLAWVDKLIAAEELNTVH